MANRTLSPLRAVTRGVAAGAVGTAAMTAAQMAYYKATGSDSSSTPGEVGKRIVEGVLQRDLPDEHFDKMNQGMHIAYGTSWGVPYAIVAGSRRSPGRAGLGGATLGLTVWGASLAELPAMKLAPPPWETPPASLATDAGFHLVYGLATALAFRALR